MRAAGEDGSKYTNMFPKPLALTMDGGSSGTLTSKWNKAFLTCCSQVPSPTNKCHDIKQTIMPVVQDVSKDLRSKVVPR
jgi:hypothetical protein